MEAVSLGRRQASHLQQARLRSAAFTLPQGPIQPPPAPGLQTHLALVVILVLVLILLVVVVVVVVIVLLVLAGTVLLNFTG